ncbi:SCP domain-containing protein [Aphelenchoides besseyi]|nr:SCP domain-containing protein [Aphelenchoides besseyi]KAI6217008.1 SCP domain-containing protein [Aphelenchoides besseyi]
MRPSTAFLVFVLLTVTLQVVESALPQDVRRGFIIATNKVRSTLAMGKQKNKNSTRLPTGKNIYQLMYSTQLEATAESLLSKCVYSYPTIPNVAGNAIKVDGINDINVSLANTIVQSWLKPVTSYGMQSVRLTARDNTTLRGYVRMVWHSAQEIGCAIKQCSGLKSTLAICLYGPATVEVGKLIYAKAPFCKQDSDCTTFSNSTCNSSTGLCYAKPESPYSTATTKTLTTSKPSNTTSSLTGTTSKTSSTTPRPLSTTKTSQNSTTAKSSITTRIPIFIEITNTTTNSSAKPASVSINSTTLKPSVSSTKLSSLLSSTLTTAKPTSTSLKPTSAAITSTTTKPTSTPSKLTSASNSNVTTTRPTTTSMKPTSSIAPISTTANPVGVVMNDTRRLAALNAHNILRSIVARGQAVNKNGTFLPNATNIYQLTYSKLVESYAIEKANSCQWNHTYVNGTSNNLYVFGSTSGFSSPEIALNQSVYSWYQELKDDGQSSLTLDSTNYNHFTEVVWANVKEIGCAVANCPKMAGVDFGANYKYTFVVCDYANKAGNVLGQNIYEAGTSCSNCPSGSTCNPDNKLCQQNGVPQIHS